jgi:hypothetical protein
MNLFYLMSHTVERERERESERGRERESERESEFVCNCGNEFEWICNLTGFCSEDVECFIICADPYHKMLSLYVDEDDTELIDNLKVQKSFSGHRREMPSGYKFHLMRLEFNVEEELFKKYLPEKYRKGEDIRSAWAFIHLF